VGYDDGSLALYDDRCLADGPLRVVRPHGQAAVRALAPVATAAGHAVVSCGEDGQAFIVSSEGACVCVDSREDYLLAACGVAESHCVVTGGMDGQVRLTALSASAASAATAAGAPE